MIQIQRAFTKTELIVVIVSLGLVLIVFAGIFLPAMGTARSARQHLKDSQQVRGVLQALILFAQNNSDQSQYPLPSELDIENTTVSETGTAKDISANIYSILLYNGLITTDALISPREKGHIRRYADYELSAPQAAVNPAEALWDPAFRSDFTGKEPGGVSYAHMLPGGSRKEQWANTLSKTKVVVANRGPRVDSVSYDENGNVLKLVADRKSKSFDENRKTHWAGNVGYNDNHVKFELMYPTHYTNEFGKERPDILFYDEPDDPAGTNAFLSLFTTAGDKRSDFTSIWD